MTELVAITDDRIREIAAQHDVSLCDHCNQPKVLHVGFNHSKRECSVDFDGWSLTLRLRDRVRVLKKLNAYFADLVKADQAELQKGAMI